MSDLNLALPVPTQTGTRLRLLSYNIQTGIASSRLHHYVTHSWKHILPHAKSFANLDRIARLISDFDIVALQEVDAGSLRSRFINQAEYMASRGNFPFCYYQINRDLGHIAQSSNALLSKFQPYDVTEHKLPGMIPGRGAIIARYGDKDAMLVFVLIHLALGRRARLSQIEFISELVRDHEHVVLMGDLNCRSQSPEMDILFHRTQLREPPHGLNTFPSWRPQRNIDHILVTPSLAINDLRVLSHIGSDHLPIALDVTLPAHVKL